jgi:3-deoxy-D-manno-octulosonic-acid transferase
MYLAYSLLVVLAVLVGSPYFVYQAMRHRKYVGSLRQRLGRLPISLNLDSDASIWIHAVSVGEVLSARPLVEALRHRYPALRLYVSTTTMTGQQVVRQQLQQTIDGLFYFPFDFAFIVRRVLNVVRPRLLVLVENEIWPHLLRESHRRGIKTMIVNGRISARSFPRYRLARPFFRRVLVDVDRFCMQGEESARRAIELGADPSRVMVTGSLKFDSATRADSHARGRGRVLRFLRVPPDRVVIVAGSTMRGEERTVLQAFRRVKATAPNAMLILAPRHAERFEEAAQLAAAEGFLTIRRTELAIDAEPRADVVVLDTIGELAQVYQLATVAFVGGSLVETGGHNILEPAVFGRPVVFGPHMSNFAEIAATFLANRAAVQVLSPRELEEQLAELVADPVRRASVGAAARALVDANRGALDRTVDAIVRLLPPVRPATIHPFRVVH